MGEKRGVKALEAWCRKITGGYRDVHIENMTTSWKDGLAFCAIIHHFQPELIDFSSLSKENVFYNNNLAFTVAEEHFGIPALLDAEDMVMCRIPDKLSIMTYVSQLYKHFHDLEDSPTKRSLDVVGIDAVSNMAEPPANLLSSSSIEASSTRTKRIDTCHACEKRVYILERLIVDNRLYHRMCFKCQKCQCVLRPGSYVENEHCDTYECVQCPLEEKKSDRSHSAIAAALRSFSKEPSEIPLSPASSTHSLNSSHAVTRDHPRSGDQVNGTSTTIGDPPPVADTGQGNSEPNPSALLKTTIQKFLESSNIVITEKSDAPEDSGNASWIAKPSRADVQNNNVPFGEKDIIIVDRVVEDDDVTLDAVDHRSDMDNAVVSEDRQYTESTPQDEDIQCRTTLPSVRPPLPERPQSLQLRRLHGQPHEEADATCKRKTVSEMVKMFARDKEKLEMQKVAVVYPQQSVLSHSVVIVARQDDHQGTRFESSEKQFQDERNNRAESNDHHQRTLPLAAPRSRRSKANNNKASEGKTELDGANVISPKIEVSSSGADTDSEKDISAQDGTTFVPPPKPPRSTCDSSEDNPVITVSSSDWNNHPCGRLRRDAMQSGYPSHLNPFNEDDVEDDDYDDVIKGSNLGLSSSSFGNKAEGKSLNPFGSSDDDDDDEVDRLKNTKPEASKPVTPAKKQTGPGATLTASLNPFSSDSDSDAKVGSAERPRAPAPIPTARISVARIAPTPSPRQTAEKSGSKTLTLGYKKRLAPKPPNSSSPTGSRSTSSSPFITPIPSPRTTRKSAAPPPPPSSSSASSSPQSRRLSEFSASPVLRKPPLPDVSPIVDSDPCIKEKSLKEMDNMILTRLSSSSSSRLDHLITPESSGSLSPNKLPNTFGYWKRRKQPAPPVPFPHRRQIRKLPLKEIQEKLADIESIQLNLEKQGVLIEKMIREKFSDDIEPSVEEEDLIMQLFELVNKKNALFRRQAELIYMRRQQRLEEEHADLEYQIRCLMLKPEHTKTEDDQQLEEKLIARLVDVVHKRNEIIESMELDRLREVEEDNSILERMALQKDHSSHHGSFSSQGSFGSVSSSASSKDSKSKKGKKKEKGSDRDKGKDEDKDLDEAEVTAKGKEKKRKWF